MLGIAAWPSPPFWRTIPLAKKASRAAGGGGGGDGGGDGGGVIAPENGKWNLLPAEEISKGSVCKETDAGT